MDGRVVKPIHGYLQHDEDSAGWAVVIQWVNPSAYRRLNLNCVPCPRIAEHQHVNQ